MGKNYIFTNLAYYRNATWRETPGAGGNEVDGWMDGWMDEWTDGWMMKNFRADAK